LAFPHPSGRSSRLAELPEKGERLQLGRYKLLITRQQEEEAMYATIRRYTPKGTTAKETIDGLKNRIEEKFTPIVQEIRGFHTYGVVNVGNKELVSISIFEDRTGAAESTRRAAEFVQKDPMKDLLGKPEVLEGDLLVLKEAGVSVR
jgi:hypothetical protein